VKEAVRGLRTVWVSKGVTLVPLDEMVASISVNRQAKVTLSEWGEMYDEFGTRVSWHGWVGIGLSSVLL
jgi:hypothetical protein